MIILYAKIHHNYLHSAILNGLIQFVKVECMNMEYE